MIDKKTNSKEVEKQNILLEIDKKEIDFYQEILTSIDDYTKNSNDSVIIKTEVVINGN